VAFGSLTEDISNADVLAKSFFDNLLKGETTGYSITNARRDVFYKSHDFHFDLSITTAVEFNLFGDPILSIIPALDRSKDLTKVTNKNLYSERKGRPEKKEISLNTKLNLNELRSLVNTEIEKIRSLLLNDLYKNYNIEPREVSRIFEIKSDDGSVLYNFNFKHKPEKGTKSFLSVFTNNKGEIKSIVSSK
jgi:uncharacterized protein YcgL (UPF0745 family)